MQVSVFLSPSAMGVSTWAEAAAVWQRWTGISPQVGRVYLGSGPWGINSDMAAQIAAGVKLLISVRPACNPVEAADFAALESFCAALQSAGANAEIAIWPEPFYSKLTQAQYVSAVRYYSPAIRPYFPLIFVTAAQAVASNSENSYYPGDAWVDGVATDIYATLSQTGTSLWLCSQPADFAIPPKPFSIWEFNASPIWQAQDEITLFFNEVQQYMAARIAMGKPCGDMLLFNGAPGKSILGNAETPNAGFEGGIGNWTSAGNCQISTDAHSAHTGGSSMAILATANGLLQVAHCTVSDLSAYGLSCSPGDTVYGAVFLESEIGRLSAAQLQWFDINDASIGTTPGQEFLTAPGHWVPLEVQATAPDGAVKCRLFPAIHSAVAGEHHNYDDAELRNVTGSNAVNTMTIEFPWDYRIPLWYSIYLALNGTGT